MLFARPAGLREAARSSSRKRDGEVKENGNLELESGLSAKAVLHRRPSDLLEEAEKAPNRKTNDFADDPKRICSEGAAVWQHFLPSLRGGERYFDQVTSLPQQHQRDWGHTPPAPPQGFARKPLPHPPPHMWHTGCEGTLSLALSKAESPLTSSDSHKRIVNPTHSAREGGYSMQQFEKEGEGTAAEHVKGKGGGGGGHEVLATDLGNCALPHRLVEDVVEVGGVEEAKGGFEKGAEIDAHPPRVPGGMGRGGVRKSSVPVLRQAVARQMQAQSSAWGRAAITLAAARTLKGAKASEKDVGPAATGGSGGGRVTTRGGWETRVNGLVRGGKAVGAGGGREKEEEEKQIRYPAYDMDGNKHCGDELRARRNKAIMKGMTYMHKFLRKNKFVALYEIGDDAPSIFFEVSAFPVCSRFFCRARCRSLARAHTYTHTHTHTLTHRSGTRRLTRLSAHEHATSRYYACMF